MDESLPLGFRFYPTEEELVTFYLHNKLNGTRPDQLDRVIPSVDIYDHDPWELPQLAGEHCREDEESEQWFFFIPRREREARGGRPNRRTTQGYWKATGSPGDVYSVDRNRVVGRKRTMVFYVGRAPHGRKTVWKMNEYKAIAETSSSNIITDVNYNTPVDFPSSSNNAANNPQPQVREEFSVCRIYKKTKCVRSFDRRPPPPADHAVVRGHQAAAHHQAAATFNSGQILNNTDNPVVEDHELPADIDNCSLDDSSSSGEILPQNIGATSDWEQWINYWLDS